MGVLLAVLASGCSYVHDGWFVNPSARELLVRVHDDFTGADIENLDPADAYSEATIEPNGVTKVEDAFDDSDSWIVEVDGAEAFRLAKDDMPEWIVTIPATACV